MVVGVSDFPEPPRVIDGTVPKVSTLRERCARGSGVKLFEEHKGVSSVDETETSRPVKFTIRRLLANLATAAAMCGERERGSSPTLVDPVAV